MRYVKVGDDMVWPHVDEELSSLERTLRYGTPSRSDLLSAAAVISAYRQMVGDTQTKRQMVIREIRAAQAGHPATEVFPKMTDDTGEQR